MRKDFKEETRILGKRKVKVRVPTRTISLDEFKKKADPIMERIAKRLDSRKNAS